MNAPSSAARGWRRTRRQRPLVLGHRGARHAAPENTFAAFDLALDEGADGVELDVRCDADGRVIVLHDPDLSRVTEQRDRRRAAELRARDLAAVDVGGGERVPSLADVLRWAEQRDTRVNIELKRDVPARARLVRSVLELLAAEPDAPERYVLSSFDPLMVTALARATPVPTAWLVHAGQRVLQAAPGRRLLGPAGVHPQASVATAARIARWQRSGAFVNVWTVNDVERARQLASFGVDALISDTPGDVARAVSRWSS